jgi:galactokinase
MGLACGAIASRSFGAGFGGSVWGIVTAEGASEFAQRWLDAYRVRYAYERATSFVANPAPGLVELV